MCRSTISKIESGQLSRGYEIILRLSLGLQVDVAELFNPSPRELPTGRRGAPRRGQGMILETPRYVYEALVADVSNKEFQPLLTVIEPASGSLVSTCPRMRGKSSSTPASARPRCGEHYEPLVLDPDDSVYFDSGAGHVPIRSEHEETRFCGSLRIAMHCIWHETRRRAG